MIFLFFSEPKKYITKILQRDGNGIILAFFKKTIAFFIKISYNKDVDLR